MQSRIVWQSGCVPAEFDSRCVNEVGIAAMVRRVLLGHRPPRTISHADGSVSYTAKAQLCSVKYLVPCNRPAATNRANEKLKATAIFKAP